MDVCFTFIDWKEAEARAKRGTLESDVFDAFDADDADCWIQDADFDDVLVATFLLGAAVDSITPHCSEANRGAIGRSFGRFLIEEPNQWNELPDKLDPEYFWFALSPATVTEIREGIDEVDFNDLKTQYQLKCPKSVRDDLEYSPDVFVEHLMSYGSLFENASELRKGLLAWVG